MINLAYTGAARHYAVRTAQGDKCTPLQESTLYTQLAKNLRQQLRPPGNDAQVKIFTSLFEVYIHLPATTTLHPDFPTWFGQTETWLRQQAEHHGLTLNAEPYSR